MWRTHGSEALHGLYGVLMTTQDLTKMSAKEFGKLLAQECPHLSYDPEGEPLAGSDPFDKTVTRVWGRLFINSGWYRLVLRTAKKIEAEINTLPEEDRKHYYIGQVKEKYAGMKFYTRTPINPWKSGPMAREAGPGWDAAVCQAIKDIVKEADAESYGICEECGKPGQPRMYGWELTHCDDCFKPEELNADAWDGCIAIDENRVHSEHGSFEIEE